MKNVANCDTWCELQNPVNHRVFERKLRPKPSGRGHVCLGVTHRVAPPRPRPSRDGGLSRGAEVGFPCPVAASLKNDPLDADVATSGGRELTVSSQSSSTDPRARRQTDPRREALRPEGRPPRLRPQVRRGYPLSLSISISGGKETNKDSPSNGERTGKSPSLESDGHAVRIVAWRSVLSGGPSTSPLEWGTGEGDSPVVLGPCRTTRRCRRVGLFGNAALIGR